MNCDLAGRLIDDYLEDELSQRDSHLLERHLAGCARCAQELRRRPAFERDVRRALAASVRPLSLSSATSTRIVRAAEENLRRAVWSHRALATFRLVGSVLATVLLVVGLTSLLEKFPGPYHLGRIALVPANKLLLSDSQPVTLAVSEPPAPRLTAASTTWLPRASLFFEPQKLQPREPFTMTVFLQSDLPRALETVRLDLDISGPTGFYRFGLAVRGPLPAHGVSILRVTPQLLAGSSQEQYLIAPTDIFALPGVYTVRMTLSAPVIAPQ